MEGFDNYRYNERERERAEEEEALDVVDLVFVPFHFVG